MEIKVNVLQFELAMVDPGGLDRSPTEAPFSPTLIHQFKLKIH